MNSEVLEDIIFHCDTGSCLAVLVQRLEKADAAAVRQAHEEGYLSGEDSWLRVTAKGWAAWKLRKEL